MIMVGIERHDMSTQDCQTKKNSKNVPCLNFHFGLEHEKVHNENLQKRQL